MISRSSFAVATLASLCAASDLTSIQVVEQGQTNALELQNLQQNLMRITNSTSDEKRNSPQVGKFRKNIYNEQYFTESVYYDYLSNFWTGYNMQSYLNAAECLTNFSLFMDSFHTWYLTSVRYRKLTELWDLFFTTAGQSANDSWYNCYVLYYDLNDEYTTKFQSFNDFGDFYLSFIFNMLSNSLNIKQQTENMIEAYEVHDTDTFVRALGQVLRSILDFNSYTSVSSSLESLQSNPEDFFMTSSTSYSDLARWERQENIKARLQTSEEEVQQRVDELKKQNYVAEKVNIYRGAARIAERKLHPQLKVAEDFTWTTRDYATAPLGTVIGALHALPQDTNGPECSSNSIDLRLFLLEGFEYRDVDDPLQAAKSYHSAGSYLDEVGVLCQQSITSTLDAAYWQDLVGAFYIRIPVNLLYNAGHMWVDAINYLYYTPETVPQQDWAFFVSYLIGDFAIRFFYHDSSPQQSDL